MKYFLLVLISSFSVLAFSQESEITKEMNITYLVENTF